MKYFCEGDELEFVDVDFLVEFFVFEVIEYCWCCGGFDLFVVVVVGLVCYEIV